MGEGGIVCSSSDLLFVGVWSKDNYTSWGFNDSLAPHLLSLHWNSNIYSGGGLDTNWVSLPGFLQNHFSPSLKFCSNIIIFVFLNSGELATGEDVLFLLLQMLTTLSTLVLLQDSALCQKTVLCMCVPKFYLHFVLCHCALDLLTIVFLTCTCSN